MAARPTLLLLSTALLLTSACTNGPNAAAGTPAGPGNAGSTTPTRPMEEADWRQPDLLFSLLPPVSGATVAVLFAGDGYYAFELVRAGARVIALETDPGLADQLKEKAMERGIGTDRLEVRLAAGGTGLRAGEADMAFCSRPYVSIPDRVNFFKAVRASLKTPAPLILVDFIPERTPVGPPVHERISDQAVMDEMEQVGCTDIGAYGKKLPYQWVVIAMDFVPGPDDGTLPVEAL